MQTDNDFSTQRITPQLVAQIIEALKNKAYGSIEIYVENYNVVQITERTITKVTQRTSQKRFMATTNQQHGSYPTTSTTKS